MKLSSYIISFCLCSFCVSVMEACNETNNNSIQLAEYESIPFNGGITHSEKSKLLQGLSKVRVLSIGNSYSWDGASYLADILYHAGISSDDYCLYIMAHDAASLKYWANRLETKTVDSIQKCAGKINMPISKGTIQEILGQNWDIIVLQQYSGDASDYPTYNPYLAKLTKAILQHTTNPNTLLAWNLIHSYSSDFCSKTGIVNSEYYWKEIAIAASMVMEKDGFDLLIPTGTAIQNARKSVLNTKHELTRDGSHLAYGVGRYIAACTWAEALFAPVFNFDIVGNNSIIDQHPQTGLSYSDSWIPVTESNKELCQLCAFYAYQNPYQLTFIEDKTKVSE